ncbi:prepilin-type N-terminal cleavage/methylation domain-containing protein [Candidatus Parcubacteria bacterium]|nr:prepilin-type N-terminal cleavage/methylation domain-containing protein [Candidatus Parcubacteria bacterium]
MGKNKQGYTLIELTVSMAVIVIISSIALVNFNSHDKKNKVDLAAYQLAGDIRKAQSYALSLKEFDFGSGMEIPKGGWGLYLRDLASNIDGYYFFADDGDHRRENNEDYGGKVLFSSGAKIKQNNGLFIDGGGENPIFISFEPPNPTVWLCDNQGASCTSGTNAEIKITEGSYTRTVKVNKFGLVDVE